MYPGRAPDWDRLYETAQSQEGHFTTEQGRDAGYSPQLLVKYLGSGKVRRVRRGVYRLKHFPPGQHEDLVVLWLWSGRSGILSHETAAHAQTKVSVPLLSFYSADDSLVPPFEAQMMAGYEVGNPLQATYEVTRGEHAYFFDRWWQQRAILLQFCSPRPQPAHKRLCLLVEAQQEQTLNG